MIQCSERLQSGQSSQNLIWPRTIPMCYRFVAFMLQEPDGAGFPEELRRDEEGHYRACHNERDKPRG
jgi:hypothetical protein